VAATDLFAEQGIDAVSVDAVAEAAGRTSGAVYAHFGSKQGLLLALLDSWKDSVLTMLLAEVAVTDSPVGQLAAVWGNLADASDPRWGRWALLEQELWLRAARDPEVAEVIRVRNAEARRYSPDWPCSVAWSPTRSPMIWPSVVCPRCWDFPNRRLRPAGRRPRPRRSPR
jgi:AcrR family transcriptional regulator